MNTTTKSNLTLSIRPVVDFETPNYQIMINLNTSTKATITDETTMGFISCYRQYFIRFKNIPENEISGVYDNDCGKIREELGVSCYQFIKQGENYNIVLSSISTGFLHDLCCFLDDFQDGKIPAYLIEAEQVGIGSYGEPVVKNIKIIKKLEYVQLAEPKPKYKMDITNPQLR